MPDKDYTPQENAIAEILSDLGLRYIRQYTIGTRWADFYLSEINSVVEADGVYGHLRNADRKRDQELKDAGIDHIIHISATKPAEIRESLLEAFKQLF